MGVAATTMHSDCISNIISATGNRHEALQLRSLNKRFHGIVSSSLSDTEKLRIALCQLLVDRNQSLFLTGKAGTGKTFVSKHLLSRFLPGELLVTASTGVAALQLGGNTVHRVLRLNIKCDDTAAARRYHSLVAKRALKKTGRLRDITRAKYMLIDEIGMISRSTLEFANVALQIYREDPRPMGGMVMIYVGDFLQLASREGFAFQSDVWKQTVAHTVLLLRPFRQIDARFTQLVNLVRIGAVIPRPLMVYFTENCRRNIETDHESTTIHIYTSRKDVTEHNNRVTRQLKDNGATTTRLKVPMSVSECQCQEINSSDCPQMRQLIWDVKESLHCQDQETEIALGARVMICKNTSNLVNGDTGIVVSFDEQGVDVQFDRITEVIRISQAKWKELHDCINHADCIKKNFHVDDCYIWITAVPLIRAAALTVNKVQGCTFRTENVTVHPQRFMFESAFYVALTRVATVQQLRVSGMWPVIRVNESALEHNDVMTHNAKTRCIVRTNSWRIFLNDCSATIISSGATLAPNNSDPTVMQYIDKMMGHHANPSHRAPMPHDVQATFNKVVCPLLDVVHDRFQAVHRCGTKRLRNPLLLNLLSDWIGDRKKAARKSPAKTAIS